jgi:four helix bundle protein
MGENIILIKSKNFSVGVRNFCSTLYYKKETVIANQLIRCGMAIGANSSEAVCRESC